jgi:lysine-N-methylase
LLLKNEPSIPLTYADTFRCIGPACEDTCCQGWSVPVDRAAWDKYQNLPESPLRVLINASVLREPQSADAAAEDASVNSLVFAKIRMNESNQCPLLTEEHLCRVQAELGEEMLSHTCATYPRIVHSIAGVKETALTFSCPEAARLVLLTPDLLLGAEETYRQTSVAKQAAEKPKTEGGGGFNPRIMQTKSEPALAAEGHSLPISRESLRFSAAGEAHADHETHEGFWQIRAVVLNLVRARIYPLWQRMFLLDMLCRRLDSIACGELKQTVSIFLAEFEAAVNTGALRPAMDQLPTDRASQLDVVLRLAGLMLHKSNVRPRFVECVHAFTAGIGNGPGATLESLTANFSLADARFYAPFMDRHPYIMENFLVNTILRCQFPFGKAGMIEGAKPDKAREFALLAAQFALMRGFLIGVAGHRREAFEAADVVHTVQAASKHFEHHPEFLNMAYALLKEKDMDGPRGLAILLRDATISQAAS